MIANKIVQNKMRRHCNLYGANLLNLNIGDFQLDDGVHEALSCLDKESGSYFLFNLFTNTYQRDLVAQALIKNRNQNVTLTCERTVDEELVRFIVRCAYEKNNNKSALPKEVAPHV